MKGSCVYVSFLVEGSSSVMYRVEDTSVGRRRDIQPTNQKNQRK